MSEWPAADQAEVESFHSPDKPVAFNMLDEIRRLRAELAEAREVADAVERLTWTSADGSEYYSANISRQVNGSWGVVCERPGKHGRNGPLFTGPTLLAALRAAVAAKVGKVASE